MKTFTLFCLLMAFATASAQIINVPGDYPTIQQGINAALAGDTVLVAEGIYYEQISFLGKPITVASNYIMDADPAYIANTILDGSLLPVGSSSVVLFTSGEDTTSIIDGFTIRNGKGTLESNYLHAAGIRIRGSGAKITNNHIINNVINASNPDRVAFGAGISTWMPTSQWIVILNNTIDNNQCISGSYDASGAAIMSFSNTRLVNNIITNNSSITGGTGCAYAAVDINSLLATNWLIAENNVIKHNSATSDNTVLGGSGLICVLMHSKIINNEISNNQIITPYYGATFGGAGIFIKLPLSSVIKGNLINDNQSGGYGGGLNYIEETFSGTAIIENNTFKSNYSVLGGGALHFEGNYDDNIPVIGNNLFISNESGYGGAINAQNSSLSVINNIFHLNTALYFDGGAINLYYDGASHPVAGFINNTFSQNTALGNGGAIYSNGYTAELLNNIFWDNNASEADEIDMQNETVSIAYTNINIDKIKAHIVMCNEGIFWKNPQLLTDPCLIPECTSPCLDKGIEQYVFYGHDTLTAPSVDIQGGIRPLNNGYDMGAYEVSILGILEKMPEEDISIYPNPFTNEIILKYRPDKTSDVSIIVYDLLGRIKASWNNVQVVGEYNTPIDLQGLQKGFYLLEIKINDRAVTKKIIKHNLL